MATGRDRRTPSELAELLPRLAGGQEIGKLSHTATLGQVCEEEPAYWTVYCPTPYRTSRPTSWVTLTIRVPAREGNGQDLVPVLCAYGKPGRMSAAPSVLGDGRRASRNTGPRRVPLRRPTPDRISRGQSGT